LLVVALVRLAEVVRTLVRPGVTTGGRERVPLQMRRVHDSRSRTCGTIVPLQHALVQLLHRVIRDTCVPEIALAPAFAVQACVGLGG
jgi:hypothetical protein